MQTLIKIINKGRRVAIGYTPKTYPPGNNELKNIITEIDSSYVDFVNYARQCVGVDAIEQITEDIEGILGFKKAENP